MRRLLFIPVLSLIIGLAVIYGGSSRNIAVTCASPCSPDQITCGDGECCSVENTATNSCLVCANNVCSLDPACCAATGNCCGSDCLNTNNACTSATTWYGTPGHGTPYCNGNYGDQSISCQNACPSGYTPSAQSFCTACGNTAWQCQWNGGCSPWCGGWSTSCGSATRTCQASDCSYYNQSTCFNGNCGAHCQTGTGNGPTCNTGAVLDTCNQAGYASGSCPVCTPGSTCNGGSCPGTCGYNTQINTDCNCGTTSSTYCNGQCGYNCDAPLDGYAHDACIDSTHNGGNFQSFCATNTTDPHCQAQTRCNPSWVQAAGSDVHSNGPIGGGSSSPLVIPKAPSNLSGPFFNYFNGVEWGIVSSSSNITFSSPVLPGPSTNISSQQSNPGDQTNPNHSYLILSYNSGNPILLNPRYDFDYFWNRYKTAITQANEDHQASGNTIQSSNVNGGGSTGMIGIYPASGCSVTFSGNDQVNGAAKSAVIFIHAAAGSSCPNGVNLNFDSTTNIDSGPGTPGNKGNVLVWIVSGNVNIDPNVSLADGVYIVQGKFTDQSLCPARNCSNFAGDKQLTIHGSIAAYGCAPGASPGACSGQALEFDRINANPALPSEIIIYNADVANQQNLVGESIYSWSEASP